MGISKFKYKEKNNILLVNITRLGDMLQATPTITGMKKENPNCKISVLVEKQFESICHWLPDIDDVLTIDLGMMVRSLARNIEGVLDAYDQIGDLVEDLRSRNFDYCLNMSSSAYTALLLRMLGVERHGGWHADAEGHRRIESDWAKLFATSVFHQNRQFNSINLVDVFRCSADVDMHPEKLQIKIDPEAVDYCNGLLKEANFSNTGPLIALQAGASQDKRQWAKERFVKLINILVNQHNARIVLTGTKKELSIIDPIVEACNSDNVYIAAGKTNIPQLAAMLSLSKVLITGDTGPMHISVAAGTPVVSMFLASAFGFETGPYSEGNIVLQPIISCGPCNPNKPCSQPDCHDHIDPEIVADLAVRRIAGDFKELPTDYVDPKKVVVYRSYFDQHGFCDFMPLTPDTYEPWAKYRDIYRRVWLDDLGGVSSPQPSKRPLASLRIHNDNFKELDKVISLANEGLNLITELQSLIVDQTAPVTELKRVSESLTRLDKEIEDKGFNNPPLGPVTRMFIFAKENLTGSNPGDLASQMKEIYRDLERRCHKIEQYNQL
jgi:ADP-heptose:LPS heptosyltransferase